MRTTSSIVIATLFFGIGSFAMAVSAHGGGASWEVPAGQYTVDVGYEPDEIVVGEPIRFDFNLKQTSDESSAAVSFAEVWVRVKTVGTTHLAAGIRKQSIGPTTLLYTFAVPESYLLEVSFRNEDGSEIAAASLPVSVAVGDESVVAPVWPIYFALGTVLGVVLASLFSTIRKARKS